MTRIKICGITNRADAEHAARCGADALGFIGVEDSPRYVPPEEYVAMTSERPLFVTRVVVTQTPDHANAYEADYVQYYEESDDERHRAWWPGQCIRAFRVKGPETLREIADYASPVAAILLDAYHRDVLGGAGETFNWQLAAEAKTLTNKPIILAGGLTPHNVADALDAVRPYGVDVSSGVESAPGVKDHAKVEAFIRAVREWDLRQ